MGAEPAVNADAAIFLDDALNRFDTLVRAGRVVVRDFIVADLHLRLRMAEGPCDRAASRALAHLATEPGADPDLTISFWDSESTGLAPLKPAWTVAAYGKAGLITGFNDSRYHTAVQLDPVILRMLDRDSRRAFCWMPDARALPHWEIGAPLRPLLHEWLSSRDRLPVHGGAVGYADGGVFLAGAGGSGKSNVALACLTSDLLYASDDFCVLTKRPQWQVHSLYCTGKVAAGDLVRHPQLADHISNRDALEREKALFFLREFCGHKLIRTMPIKAIVMPQLVGRGRSAIEPAGAAAAQRAIAMSTIELSRWAGASTFPEVARFVRAVPCYTLKIGDDLPKIPELIAGLLKNL